MELGVTPLICLWQFSLERGLARSAVTGPFKPSFPESRAQAGR
jgi:hypothetical protein